MILQFGGKPAVIVVNVSKLLCCCQIEKIAEQTLRECKEVHQISAYLRLSSTQKISGNFHAKSMPNCPFIENTQIDTNESICCTEVHSSISK